MKKRILGRNARGEPLEVGAIGLGCRGLSVSFPPFPTRPQSFSLLRRAAEIGVELFDTSESYGVYRNETLVGEGLLDWREQVCLSTKFGWQVRSGKCIGLDSSPAAIRKAVDGSLRRLKTDHIDVYFQHRVDPKVPIEEVAGTVHDLFDQGKILHWGLSEARPETIMRADKEFHMTCVQSEYSLWYRDIEYNGVLDTLGRLGIGLVASVPLGRGALTGTVLPDHKFPANDVRNNIPRFNNASQFARNLKILESLNEYATKLHVTPAQMALVWLLHRRDWIVPIPGTRSIQHLEENCAAADKEFSHEDCLAFRAEFEQVSITGDRYDAYNLSMVGR